MKPMTLNVSKMKKIGGDTHSSTFMHPDGHEIKVAHAGLTPIQKKQISSLPIHKFAEGGEVNAEIVKRGQDILGKQTGNRSGTSEDISNAFDRSTYSPYSQSYENEQRKAIRNRYADGGLVGEDPESYLKSKEQSAPKDALPPTDNEANQYSPPSNEVGGVMGVPPEQNQDKDIQDNSGKEWEGSAGVETPSQQQEQLQGLQGGQNAGNHYSAAIDGTIPSSDFTSNAQTGLDLQGAYNQGQRGISEAQAVESAKSKSAAELGQKDVADREKLNNDYKQNIADFTQHQQHFMNDLQNEHIDPQHYVESMDSGKKVATGIGLLLGGFGSSFTGQGNPAMDFLNKQIDRDIEGQKTRMDKEKTLLGANQAAFHDQMLAENQTRINMNDIYDHKIQLEANKLGTPAAKAAADMAHSKYALENAELLNKNALRSTALKAVQGGTGDPARLVPLLVPKEHQAKAFAEIQAAEDTNKMASSIMQSFEGAAKKNTALRTGAGFLRTPAEVYALHQSMQPTFKDLEGTVRQAAMDNTFKNITPMPGDSDGTIATKRQALQDYLQSKISAPTARGYGIDLKNFQSTRPAQQQEVQTKGGVQYVKVPGGWKKL